MRRQYSTFPFANAIRNFRQTILSIWCYETRKRKKEYAGRAPAHTTICVKIPVRASFISSIGDKTKTPNPTYYNPKNPSNGT